MNDRTLGQESGQGEGHMASITRRNGSYRVRIYRGNNQSISKSFSSESEAKSWLKATQAKLELGLYKNPKKVAHSSFSSFSEAAERYIATHSVHKKSFASEAGIFRILIQRWLGKSVYQVNKECVLALRDDLLRLGRSHSTINHYFNCISKLYQMISNEMDIDVSNPIIGLKRMPQSKGRTKRVEPDVEKQLLKGCEKLGLPLLALIIQFAIQTGMRRGEFMRLTWADIDMTKRNAFLQDTKNGESRKVPLTRQAMTVLAALSKDQDRLFPIGMDALRSQFSRVRKYAKSQWAGYGRNPFVDLRIHDLRHEALSRLSDAGLNVIELAHISGHQTLSMLKRYTHPSHEAIFAKLDK